MTHSQNQIHGLLAIQVSSERYCLLGETLKRLAQVAPRELRAQYIEAARNAYVEACGQAPNNLYYPFLNVWP
ncbi:MAG: hypothetical protein HC810_05910 [Acaryochloridaceae cyanobacterium RL_2_7]|nr:hypothetical protein [Acaryochloridaceae cyanobacterium RL_2_7]